MKRAIHQALVGALLLGTGCAQPGGATEPAPNPIVKTPQFIEVVPTSRVNGWAWDPEAYWYAYATANNCTSVATCPLQSPLSASLPYYQLAIVRGASVELLDSSNSNQPIKPAVTIPSTGLQAGLWTVTDVPGRTDRPFFVRSSATGGVLSTTAVGGMSPPPPATKYLPMVVNRPIVTHYPICLLQEAIFMSDVGVLDAVARFLTNRSGSTVLVDDFVNASLYDSVNVFWLYQPGQTMMRMPAPNTTVEASAGEALHVNWAPPGTAPDPALQSPRGYYVSASGPSNAGVVVVLVRAGQASGAVTYTPKDTWSSAPDSATLRPWGTSPLTLPPRKGVVSVSSVQFRGYQVNPSPPPSHVCAPLQ